MNLARDSVQYFIYSLYRSLAIVLILYFIFSIDFNNKDVDVQHRTSFSYLRH